MRVALLFLAVIPLGAGGCSPAPASLGDTRPDNFADFVDLDDLTIQPGGEYSTLIGIVRNRYAEPLSVEINWRGYQGDQLKWVNQSWINRGYPIPPGERVPFRLTGETPGDWSPEQVKAAVVAYREPQTPR